MRPITNTLNKTVRFFKTSQGILVHAFWNFRRYLKARCFYFVFVHLLAHTSYICICSPPADRNTRAARVARTRKRRRTTKYCPDAEHCRPRYFCPKSHLVVPDPIYGSLHRVVKWIFDLSDTGWIIIFCARQIHISWFFHKWDRPTHRSHVVCHWP